MSTAQGDLMTSNTVMNHILKTLPHRGEKQVTKLQLNNWLTPYTELIYPISAIYNWRKTTDKKGTRNGKLHLSKLVG